MTKVEERRVLAMSSCWLARMSVGRINNEWEDEWIDQPIPLGRLR